MATPTEASGSRPPAALPGEAAAAVPGWFPRGPATFAELYYAGTTCLFVLHGNVHDLVRLGDGDQAEYGSLPEFLATQLFGSWDLVLRHDLSQGLRALRGARRRPAAEDGRPGHGRGSASRSPGPATPTPCSACSTNWCRQMLMEEDPGPADPPGRDPRIRPVPRAVGRARPDGRCPGHAAGPPALLGSEPLHQAAQHRVLPALRPPRGDQRAAGRQLARRDAGRPHAGRRGARAIHRALRRPGRHSRGTSPTSRRRNWPS